MKLNLSSLLLLITSGLAPLPIFVDLANLSIIFTENVYFMDKPQIPLPLSVLFFAIVLIINLPNLIKKISYGEFYTLFSLFVVLLFLTIINGIPILKLIQFYLPLVLILSVTLFTKYVNKYVIYSFPISLSIFSLIHLSYYFTNIEKIPCEYNCPLIFWGYEIYHGDVGFPEVVMSGLCCCLILSQFKINYISKTVVIFMSMLLLSYAVFIARGATILVLALATILLFYKSMIRSILKAKLSRVFVFNNINYFFNQIIIDKIFVLYQRIAVLFSFTSIHILHTYTKYYFEELVNDPISLIFGGASKSIVGHNSALSILTMFGILGLILLLKSYLIGFSIVKKNIDFKLSEFSEIELYSFYLFLISIVVGNTINDSITQPFNTIAGFITL